MPSPQIEGYTDLVQVAKGGFGVVYRARQERFDRVVAVKVLSVVDLTDRDRERFDRECRAMGALSWHPNVVAVYDSGVADDGHPFLAMEYLSGGSMGDRLATGPFAWEEAVRVGVQVAGALGAAHAAGTLHRDLKPENLLVGPFGEAKLGDFGIAAVSGSSGTTTGTASLTVAHVAPELLAGDRPDERSDVYGLASTLHTLVTGRPPFVEERGEPVAAIITRVLRSPAPPAAGAPDDLAELLQQCLAKDPAARPQTAAALGQRLQEVQAARGVPVTELRLAPHSTPEDPAPTAGHPGDSSPTVVGIPTVPPPDPTEASERPAPPPEPQRAPPAEEPPARQSAPASAPPAARSRARGVLVAALLVLIVLVAGAIAVGLSRSGTDAASDGEAGTPPSTERSDEPAPFTEPAVVASIGVDPDPVGIAATGADLWVTHSVDAGTVTRIDATTNQVAETIAVGRTPRGVAATADAVWVTNFDDDTVTRIDPASGDVVDTLAAGPSPRGVAATADAVWVTNFDDGTVTRIDPSSGAIVATVTVGTEPLRVEATGDQVWVTNSAGDTVSRIDPAVNQVVATVTVGARPHSVTLSDGAVWVSTFEDGTVVRIDPDTDEVAATIDVGPGLGTMAASDDALWVANTPDGTLTRISLAEGAVQATIPTGDGAAGVTLAEGAVWVANTGADDISRVEPASG